MSHTNEAIRIDDIQLKQRTPTTPTSPSGRKRKLRKKIEAPTIGHSQPPPSDGQPTTSSTPTSPTSPISPAHRHSLKLKNSSRGSLPNRSTKRKSLVHVVQTRPQLSRHHSDKSIPFQRVNASHRNVNRHVSKNAKRIRMATMSDKEKQKQRRASINHYNKLHRYMGKFCSEEQRKDRQFDVMDFISQRMGARIKGHLARRDIQRQMFAAYYIQLWWRTCLPARQSFLRYQRSKRETHIINIQRMLRFNVAKTAFDQMRAQNIVVQQVCRAETDRLATAQALASLYHVQPHFARTCAVTQHQYTMKQIRFVQREIKGNLWLLRCTLLYLHPDNPPSLYDDGEKKPSCCALM